MFEYSGALHIHSIFSDGTGTIEQIASFANEMGLDFIMMTDHNTLEPKFKGYERWYNNTLVLVGYELNDLQNNNHYLVFGTDELAGEFEQISDEEKGNKLSAEEYVHEINKKGGTGIIAHPFEKRKHIIEHPSYPWTEWNSKEFNGMEIWNHMSQWAEGLTEKNKLQRFLHPLKSIIAPDEETLNKWDELNLERKVIGVGSIDAHAHKQNVLGFFEVEIFPYKILFKSIRTHILCNNQLKPGDFENFESHKSEVLNAIREGHSFIVNSYHGNGKGFRFFAEYDGNSYIMGDEITLDKTKNKNITFKVFVPKEAEIRLLHNGKIINKTKALDCFFDYNLPGNYRVECRINEFGWIFSNHIRVI
ncbi:MAG: PHP domain-containing protein [Ignavibacteria bacterium]|nr:PHP domain-containing protein [Ignavibacteria bacterium]